MLPADTHLLADAEAVAAEACRLIGNAAQDAIRQRRLFRLVLAGGHTPRRCYQLLAATEQDWAAWEIFWSDERCRPAGHPERNDCMAQAVWLGRVAIPAAQLHPIPVELGPEKAATRYGALLAEHLPFDLVLLGMGEDGHTASLFPQAAAQDAPVIAVHGAPKPPAERVSLNYQSLQACRQQLVLVTGGEKSSALAAWQQNAGLPIARAVTNHACLLTDVAAGRLAGLGPTLP